MISQEKLEKFLMEINFQAEKLPQSQEEADKNRIILDVIDSIFKAIESGRLR